MKHHKYWMLSQLENLKIIDKAYTELLLHGLSIHDHEFYQPNAYKD